MKQTPHCEEVIIAETTRGDGSKETMRVVRQVFRKDGSLIAEHDPLIELTPDALYEEIAVELDKVLNIHGQADVRDGVTTKVKKVCALAILKRKRP